MKTKCLTWVRILDVFLNGDWGRRGLNPDERSRLLCVSVRPSLWLPWEPFKVNFVMEKHNKQICIPSEGTVSLRRIWTKLGGNYSYKPPGVSHTAQRPQKQPEILKTNFLYSIKNGKSLFLDLDFGFQTFAAGSRKEISCRIRIRGPNLLLLSSRAKI